MKVRDIAELNYNQRFRVDLYNVSDVLVYVRTERAEYDGLTEDALNAEVALINSCGDDIWLSAVRRV